MFKKASLLASVYEKNQLTGQIGIGDGHFASGTALEPVAVLLGTSGT